MTAEGTTVSSLKELVVSVEQANALIDLIGIREGHNALSSVIPVSELISAGLADSDGLIGDAEAMLGPARTVDSRLAMDFRCLRAGSAGRGLGEGTVSPD